MIPGKLICLPFNLRKRTLLFWSSLCALPTQKSHYLLEISSLLIISWIFWRALTHMFVSLNRHVAELHVNGVTGRVFLCPSLSVYSVSCPYRLCRNAYLWSVHSPTAHPLCGRWAHHKWLIRSATDGHSGCFQLGVIAAVLPLCLLGQVSENFSQE